MNPIELKARVRVVLREKAMVDLLKEQARLDALTDLHNCSAYDTPCHFGGDEFAVILNQSTGEAALCAAIRLRETLDLIEIEAGDTRLHPRTSAGLVSTRRNAQWPEGPLLGSSENYAYNCEALADAVDSNPTTRLACGW